MYDCSLCGRSEVRWCTHGGRPRGVSRGNLSNVNYVVKNVASMKKKCSFAKMKSNYSYRASTGVLVGNKSLARMEGTRGGEAGVAGAWNVKTRNSEAAQ